MKYLQVALCLALLTACQKDEIPVEFVPLGSGDGGGTGPAAEILTQVEMTESYLYQLHYDFETDSVTAIYTIMDWDLAFDCQQSRIRLNSARVSGAYDMGVQDFGAVQGREGIAVGFDSSDGLEQVISGDEPGHVYIIDLGRDEEGQPIGEIKIRLVSTDMDGYTLEHGAVEDMVPEEVFIPKDLGYANVHWSAQYGVRFLEPEIQDWDILFTQYTQLFTQFDPPVPYPVRGVLMNPYEVQATSRYEEIGFEELGRLDIVANMTDEEDIIGYDWKEFDINQDSYAVNQSPYGIQTYEGNIYKLRFLSFVDSDNSRGYPTFQASLLNE